MSNMIHKINGRTRTTRKREWDIFPWPEVRAQVVPLLSCCLIDFWRFLSIALCEEAAIRPGQCQRQKQDEHKGTKTRSVFKESAIFVLFIERLLILLLAR